MVSTVVGSSPMSVIIYIYILTNRIFRGCVTEWFNVPGLSLGVLFRTRSSNLLASVDRYPYLCTIYYIIYWRFVTLCNQKVAEVRISSRPIPPFLTYRILIYVYYWRFVTLCKSKICWSSKSPRVNNIYYYIQLY